jgi:hypothetical protein
MALALAPLLTDIYKSLTTGIVPGDWSEANVTPIFKKGIKTQPENYRLVSLTSVSCKVLGSLIKDKVMAHPQKNKLLKSCQHGFMPVRSCTTNLLTFLEKATAAINIGQSFDAIFFAKAFDKVPRARLLKKVRAHGICRPLLRWIQN